MAYFIPEALRPANFREKQMTLDIKSDAPKDFDFIIGTWQVKHRRLKSRLTKSTDWIEFDGLSSTQKSLVGLATWKTTASSPRRERSAL